jgi:hypothetical protein
VLTCAWATHFDTFWTGLWREGLAIGITCCTKGVTGALLLLFPFTPINEGHQFLLVGIFPDRRLYLEKVRTQSAERGNDVLARSLAPQPVGTLARIAPQVHNVQW